ncbi:MAG TPA: exodeoxyribonuclease V subunit gamma, partial [Gammaproteobacteria bacterium]|nr:exodeoxyribonuclease V subunit gamma [Gammaproteobacteria bacterium]
MFHLYQHHDLSTLASMLAALRERAAPASPLAADTVLVPNRGTARWLQAELAEAEGTATNLDLLLPAPFVWRVLWSTVNGGEGRPDSSDFERERLVWHLYALLPGLRVAEVQRYLAAEPRERHRYQLAQQLADVFDQYLIHRRDVLAAWEAGEEERYPPASWQAPVWRAVVGRIEERHRAQLLTDF